MTAILQGVTLRYNAINAMKIFIRQCAIKSGDDGSKGSSSDDKTAKTEIKTEDEKLPRPVRQKTHSKVRMGFVPEEWFSFFHKKTGVTGPYMFAVSLGTYLCSKEIYILGHDYYGGLSMGCLCYLAVTKVGPGMAKYLDREIDAIQESWDSGQKETVQNISKNIEDEKKEQWRSEGNLMVMQAKRENVAMQLEANYRDRQMMVYTEVKNRLDYHLSVSQTERRIQHKNLLEWVVKSVLASITPQLEQEALKSCITDLNAMAVKA